MSGVPGSTTIRNLVPVSVCSRSTTHYKCRTPGLRACACAAACGRSHSCSTTPGQLATCAAAATTFGGVLSRTSSQQLIH